MNKHTPGPWYTTTKPDDLQGLVCSEQTGANIAVTYAAKDAEVVAAAPELAEALAQILTASNRPSGATIGEARLCPYFKEMAKAALEKAGYYDSL